jgi:hypothetical protein
MITKEKYQKALKIVEEYESEYLNISDVTKRNWFQKMPLHWRYLYYMFGGIVIGLLLHYVW